MATLVHNPHAVSTMVNMLGRTNISAQDLQTANELPVAQMMIDSNSLGDIFVKHNAYESAKARWCVLASFSSSVHVLNPRSASRDAIVNPS